MTSQHIDKTSSGSQTLNGLTKCKCSCQILTDEMDGVKLEIDILKTIGPMLYKLL